MFLEHNEYVGVAPVPVWHYQEYMRRFRAATPRSATPERVREAFAELVLTPRVLDNLGPAINAQRVLSRLELGVILEESRILLRNGFRAQSDAECDSKGHDPQAACDQSKHVLLPSCL